MLRGCPEGTSAATARVVARFDEARVLRVDRRSAARARKLLGQGFDAVVLDFHGGVDADVLGMCHGFVWGGGLLVLRLPPRGELVKEPRLVVHPWTVEDVGTRFQRRFERVLETARAQRISADAAADAAADADADAADADADADARRVGGTRDQALVVQKLVRLLGSESPRRAVLTADRGRGKSSALGLALGEVLSRREGLRVAVTAGERDAAAEVFRHAGAAGARLEYVPPTELATSDVCFDVVVVDEAAQLPVAVLQRIVARHGQAHIAFATTTRGYEGTGRGFVLRFMDWLRARGPLEELTLQTPIRWDAGDPVEAFVFDALLLDAEPAQIDAAPTDPEALELDRDALAHDERTLREVFGLLVHAHYRTTPGDLHRLLDAPNMRIHVLRADGHVVAANLLALEGRLSAELADDVFWGRHRLRAHALADTLVAHLGRREAGPMRMVRSVRIATHPDVRRLGLASRLTEAVHSAYAPDLFGTVFGATAELIAFRRQLGYEVVRLSAARGARTGEPAVTMIRPASSAARELVAQLRDDLARELPLQLELLEADHSLLLDDALKAALSAGLPDPSPLTDERVRAEVAAYAFGPRTFESVAAPITRWVTEHEDASSKLSTAEAAVVRARVLERRSWHVAAERAGLPHVRAAMRALRRALRSMVAAEDPSLAPPA